jgi:hypothetical protein
MKNNKGFFITLFILAISILLIFSSIIISSSVLVYSKGSLLEKSTGANSNTNNTGDNTNSSSQKLSTPTAQDCKNSQNGSAACQEQSQPIGKQQSSQQQQEQSKPDNSCLFHPEQMKCKPDPITGKCPKGFSMNVYEHCFPKIPCPKGFENHDEDETGTCYPVHNANSTRTLVSK